ncbi:MAG: hypothetical protein AAFN81_10740 [Bacteroidota bacterium]
MNKTLVIQTVLVFVVFTLFCASGCQDVDDLAQSIATADRVECAGVGFAGTPSSVYKTFTKLRSKASKEDLLQLLEHENPAVRVYAYYSLIDRNLIPADQLFQQAMEKDTSVSTFCGCTMSGSRLSFLVYNRYWQQRVKYYDNGDELETHIEDSPVLRTMDSLILYSTPPDLFLAYTALGNRIYSEAYRPRIEALAFTEDNFQALEYVYENWPAGNEDRLVEKINEYLADDDAIGAIRSSSYTMLRKLQELREGD